MTAGALHADAAVGDHDVAALHIRAGGSAGPHPNERIRAAFMQLLNADGGGGAADAGGGDGDLFALQRALPGGKFPLSGHEAGVVQVGGNEFAAVRVAGDDGVAAHLAPAQVDMQHFLGFVHDDQCFFS